MMENDYGSGPIAAAELRVRASEAAEIRRMSEEEMARARLWGAIRRAGMRDGASFVVLRWDMYLESVVFVRDVLARELRAAGAGYEVEWDEPLKMITVRW